MKIRTITAGITLSLEKKEPDVSFTALFLNKAKELFTSKGSEVQSIRLSTQPWVKYLRKMDEKDIIDNICDLENLCIEKGVDFLSIGTIFNADLIDIIPRILKKTKVTSCSVTIGNKKNGINFEAIKKTAQAILEISRITDNGIGNFSFAGIVNCPPDIPFFPASYHKGKPVFSIGTESGDLVMNA
ncbi:unnamed protein product, partial [marine sediment metagenome]